MNSRKVRNAAQSTKMTDGIYLKLYIFNSPVQKEGNLPGFHIYTVCNLLFDHSSELNSLKEEVMNLKRRNIKLEAYTRRENIKIFGIEDERGESNTRTDELVRIMMREKMNIPEEDVEGFQFERVPRNPTRQDIARSSKPRPIIAKFSFYKDKEYMWSFVKNLKGRGIGISNDFPKEIDEIHQKLYPVLKEVKRKGQKASFKVDKLIISGQVYRGAETESLAHYGSIMNS